MGDMQDEEENNWDNWAYRTCCHREAATAHNLRGFTRRLICRARRSIDQITSIITVAVFVSHVRKRGRRDFLLAWVEALKTWSFGLLSTKSVITAENVKDQTEYVSSWRKKISLRRIKQDAVDLNPTHPQFYTDPASEGDSGIEVRCIIEARQTLVKSWKIDTDSLKPEHQIYPGYNSEWDLGHQSC